MAKPFTLNHYFDLVTLSLKLELLLKNFILGHDFLIRRVIFCCYLRIAATGELCCLFDNSGFNFWVTDRCIHIGSEMNFHSIRYL